MLERMVRHLTQVLRSVYMYMCVHKYNSGYVYTQMCIHLPAPGCISRRWHPSEENSFVAEAVLVPY